MSGQEFRAVSGRVLPDAIEIPPKWRDNWRDSGVNISVRSRQDGGISGGIYRLAAEESFAADSMNGCGPRTRPLQKPQFGKPLEVVECGPVRDLHSGGIFI